MSLVEQELWLQLQDELSRRIPQVLFEQWFARAEILSCTEDEIELGVQNRFFKSRIETTYLTMLREAATSALGRPMRVSVSVSPRLFAAFRESQERASAELAAMENEPSVSSPEIPQPEFKPVITHGLELNRDFTFDRFVVGASNRLSHAVALKSVECPGEYERIYFCGQHGVGKTHLLQAICHETLRQRPHAAVVYVTCERFVADFIAAHADGKTKEFRAFYRECDVLAFDELQALGVGSKNASQAELLGIIDALDTRGKQVVLGATHAPEELEGIDPKLVDRLGAGFVDKLSLPDERTRRDLIVTKMSERGLELPKAAVNLIARELAGNVRKLEGTVNRLAALIEIEGMEPTTSCIRMALEVFTPISRKTALTFQDILQAVTEEYGVTVEAMIGRGRAHAVRSARQLAVVLCRRLVGGRYAEIGEVFGKRSHATIISIVKKVPRGIFSSGLEGRPLERILFRLGVAIKPEELLERQGELFE